VPDGVDSLSMRELRRPFSSLGVHIFFLDSGSSVELDALKPIG
jgi:hypothetical protein